MTDPWHPHAVRMPWTRIETSLMPLFAYRDCEGRAAGCFDLSG